jgi:hypothetical protein
LDLRDGALRHVSDGDRPALVEQLEMQLPARSMASDVMWRRSGMDLAAK